MKDEPLDKVSTTVFLHVNIKYSITGLKNSPPFFSVSCRTYIALVSVNLSNNLSVLLS